MRLLESLLAVGVLLCAPTSHAGAQERVAIFRGSAGGNQIHAYSVPVGTGTESYNPSPSRPGRVVLIYENYAEASSLEPRAVFSGSAVAVFNDEPQRSRLNRTIADLIKAANIAGPKKTRVVCLDGTRVSPSGRSQLTQLLASWRVCASRGGVDRWYQTSTPDTNAVVATICRDYRLTAGDGDGCGNAGRLASIRNRKY